jgi:Xaa-Pro aminopeptidase
LNSEVSREFPLSEFQHRLARTQQAMHQSGLDALFFNTEPEIRYYTGFRTAFWASPTRPWYLVVPIDGLPIAVIPEIGRPLMRTTWIDSIYTWHSPAPDNEGLAELIAVLQPFRRVGMPMGRESQLRMPLADFNRLRDKLPRVEWVDGSALVQSIRQIKSENEIDRIRHACAATSKAFDRLPTWAHVGMPLEHVFKRFQMDLLDQGAHEVPYLVGGCGADGYPDVISPPDTTPIRPGDVLMLDTGATYRGYFSDFNRNFGFGTVSDQCLRDYELLFRATELAINLARPGTTAKELYTTMAKATDQAGSNVGRFGHGLGMQLTEPPSNSGHDDTVLESGMVITLEPSLQRGDCMMVHEEDLVIRDGPPELLSTRAPATLPLIR